LSLAEGGLTPGHELTADIRCELSRLNTLQQSFHET